MCFGQTSDCHLTEKCYKYMWGVWWCQKAEIGAEYIYVAPASIENPHLSVLLGQHTCYWDSRILN